jgi:hypothetical protein
MGQCGDGANANVNISEKSSIRTSNGQKSGRLTVGTELLFWLADQARDARIVDDCVSIALIFIALGKA